MAKVTGLGGIFYVVEDPARTREWYRDVLGIDGQYGPHLDWSRETFEKPFSLISNFADDTYIKPGKGGFMINLRVDELDEFVAGLMAKGVEILGQVDESYGKFAWILDPDGVKIERWQQVQVEA